MPSSASSSPAQLHRNLTSVLDQQKGKRPLQRSQSLMLSPVKSPASSTSSLRGPVMSICCDCKGMIMEILRASKTTIAMLQPSSSTTASQELLPHTSSESPTSNCWFSWNSLFLSPHLYIYTLRHVCLFSCLCIYNYNQIVWEIFYFLLSLLW